MRVIPFGTSSGRPTATRHVSGLAVDLGPSWILVDCGEGIQQQIMRSPLKPSRLALVLVTHLHGDHVLGLPGLLGTLGMEGRTRPLPIVSAEGMGQWLDAMCALPILGLDFPVPVTELVDDAFDGRGGDPSPVAEIAGATVSALPLRHRVPSFGYRVTEPDRVGRIDAVRARELGVADGPDMGRLQRGESVEGATGLVLPSEVTGPPRRGRVVTVLGDTTRCDASVALARDAALVVHETTFANRDQALADQWKHATPADAAFVAATAGAERLLINHFSSRYDDPDELLREARAGFPATEAAVELEPVDIP
ncbi:MAG: ribonuclease Z [Acidimicrobiales bacterium]